MIHNDGMVKEMLMVKVMMVLVILAIHIHVQLITSKVMAVMTNDD